MKSIFLLTFFLLCMSWGYAQDIITLQSGDEIEGKVVEITLDLIKYSKKSDGTPPLYSIKKSEVFMIKYENGSKDVFESKSEDSGSPSKSGSIQGDQIEMKKVLGGYRFYQNGKLLNINQISDALKIHPEAYSKFESVRSNYMLATILGAAGGALVGWPLGVAIGGGDPPWGLAGVGAVLIIVSVPVSSKFNKGAKEAVDIYNESIAGHTKKYQLNWVFSPHKTGIILTF